jgi:hypothetical protein
LVQPQRFGRLAVIMREERLSFDGIGDDNAFQLEQVLLNFRHAHTPQARACDPPSVS